MDDHSLRETELATNTHHLSFLETFHQDLGGDFQYCLLSGRVVNHMVNCSFTEQLLFCSVGFSGLDPD